MLEPPVVDTFLSMDGIHKRFGPAPALEGASIACSRGEIHGVLGENGAGKTTLMRILAGLVRADSGMITIGGRIARIRSPIDAAAAGIGMVHQHFMLVPDLTGVENLALSSGWAAARAAAEGELAASLAVDLQRRVSALSMGERQRVEILRALHAARDILILDEPTAVLTPHEIRPLFSLLLSLKSSGRTIIFISHKLAEVKEICDSVTVLRAGRSAAAGSGRSFSMDRLAELMVGERAAAPLAARAGAGAGERAVFELACGEARGFGPLSLTVREREILGVAGVDGNGQRELMLAAAGFRGGAARLVVDGVDCRNASEAARNGVRVIPPDRRHEGIVQSLTIAENLALGNEELLLRKRGAAGGFNRGAIERAAADTVDEFDIRAPRGPGTMAGTLSGGNQQKLLLARVFASNPRVIIAVNPTWGLDIKATSAVRELLRSAAAGRDGGRPAGILLISVDLEEIDALSDRVVVLYRGRLSESLPPGSPEIPRRMAGLGMRLGG